jgi:hypothetical protein
MGTRRFAGRHTTSSLQRNLAEHHISAILCGGHDVTKRHKTFFLIRVLTETCGLRINVTVFVLFN